MTNSEAIEWLKEIPRAYGVRRDKEPCEAFVLAIKALDENEKLNKEIPALLNRIDELQGMIARRDVEIAHLKEKEVAINQKVIDRTIERLKENKVIGADCIGIGFECIPLFKAIEIVKEESKK